MLKFFLNIFLCFVVLGSCKADVIDGWKLDVQSVDVYASFSLEQEVETYTGDIMLHKIEQKPSEGFSYVVISIVVSREDTKSKFYSESLKLFVDSQLFDREKEDVFLIDYGLKPFTHLNIKLGVHRGVLIFAVPSDLIKKPMSLVYGNKKIKLPQSQVKKG